jgi:hypothetical protein
MGEFFPILKNRDVKFKWAFYYDDQYNQSSNCIVNNNWILLNGLFLRANILIDVKIKKIGKLIHKPKNMQRID